MENTVKHLFMENTLKHLSQLQHTFIAGLTGTGKDLLASVAIKTLKKQEEIKVYVIQLTGDCQENYYDKCADIIRNQNVSQMISESPDNLFNWIKSCFDEFAQIKGKKLLILSEVNLLFDYFSQNEYYRKWLVDNIITYLSIGKSSNAYLWFTGQTFNLQNIAMLDCSILSVINLVFIIKLDNLVNYDYICQTSFIPFQCRNQISLQEIETVIIQSPVKRAVFYGGSWSPMPMLAAC